MTIDTAAVGDAPTSADVPDLLYSDTEQALRSSVRKRQDAQAVTEARSSRRAEARRSRRAGRRGAR